MNLLLIGLGILLGGGLLSAVCSRIPRFANAVGSVSAVVGSLLALVPAVQSVFGGLTIGPISMPWNMPVGSLTVAVDPLSAWFLIPILGLCALAAVYGFQYLLDEPKQSSLGSVWFFYNLLAASMVLVVIARNGLLFLIAWELMSLSSFFLVAFHNEESRVRESATMYLIAMHLGAAFLLAFFVVLGSSAGSLDFSVIAAWVTKTGGFSQSTANILFVLAVIGFGTKAGFMPLHVWLPEAHPIAPSHVSAVMSGVMIKTGIYGLLRTWSFLGTPPVWWAWVMIGIGVTSGVLGVLFALAQHDLKRLLAYSSVENIGVIALGLGIGLLGAANHNSVMTVFGFSGALLHVLNHAMFKGLLFLGAGAVIHSTGTGEINQLGGLLKRMPWAAAAFAVGAVAISGLPPLNGFVGEFLIYLGAYRGNMLTSAGSVAPALAVIGGLALIGGLATACFTNAFGIVFLGEPRTEAAANAHHPGLLMTVPMLILAACCLLVGLCAVPIVHAVIPIVGTVIHQSPETVLNSETALNSVTDSLESLSAIVLGAFGVLVLTVVLVLIRRQLLSGRVVETSGTWGCGYARPTARMQYTSSSFAQPLTDFFAPFLQTERTVHPAEGLFPQTGSLRTHTPDVAMRFVFRPLFRGVSWLLSRLSWIQHGHVHLYVLYIALTILALLIWYLGVTP